jgi:hypothetical protein
MQSLYRTTAIVFIVTPILFMTFFTLLSINFEYPDILREPTDHILTLFDEGGTGLIWTWYGMVASALLFIPLALLTYRALPDAPFIKTATTFGILAGVMQALGLVRWPFVVPYLAETYLDPASSEATKAAVEVVFQGFHRYAGVALGEHLGFMFTAFWTVLLSIGMMRSPIFKPALAYMGIVLGVGIFMGVLEPVGWEVAAEINAWAYTLWALWLIAVGVFFFLASRRAPANA